MQEIIEVIDKRIENYEQQKKELAKSNWPAIKFKFKSDKFYENLMIENKILELKYVRTLMESKIQLEYAKAS